MRPIDADALIIAISESAAHRIAHSDGTQFDVGRTNGLILARDIVFNTPTIDPVRHGRWEYSRTQSEFAVNRCSVCGQEQFAISNVVAEGNYCPSCGAKMDREARNVE